MLAMQYTIPLSPDYDMAKVDERVEARKAHFDSMPGLLHKAYLANDDDKIYAPFYIWKDATQLKSFLMDDLFLGVLKTFNRPRVRSWAVLGHMHGEFKGFPTFAMRETDAISVDADLEAFFAAEREKQDELLLEPGLYLTVLGLDPDRWEVMRYSIWENEESATSIGSDCVQTYRVMHV